jgi:alpha-galactosidase
LQFPATVSGMGRPPFRACICAVALSLYPVSAAVRAEDHLIDIEDAYVNSDGNGWTIGNSLIKYSLARQGNATKVRGIFDTQSDRDWNKSNTPDTFVGVNRQRVDIGSTATPLMDVLVNEFWGGVRLDLRYRYAPAAIEITRTYACYPGSSVIETWTTFRVTGARVVQLSDLTNFSFAIEPGMLRWIRGINTPDEDGGPFTLASGELEDGQVFEIGSDRRSSENHLPWFGVSVEDAQFFGSLIWNGQWRFVAERHGDVAQVRLGLPAFTTSLGPGASLETPHAIFGITNNEVPETSMALRSFIDKRLRRGRALPARVSYNSWYSYGTFVDEASMLAEMEMSAALGVELFVVDAGWWLGINTDDPGDFTRAWGSWEVDPDRFPNGLGALADRAHELGMRFGVWVEPERVDRQMVGRPGLVSDRMLAMRDGRYDPGVPNTEVGAAQVCLADAPARDWMLNKISSFIEEARPDYLKWDNNFWINCNRSGHGHGTEDGNFAHHRGLRTLLDQLRERYPDLDIENSASGGNRLSLDMLAYSDVGWVDDHTFPSSRVRHNLQGLAVMLPTAYLSAFTLSTMEEPVVDDPNSDLRTVLRSRMEGALGISWQGQFMSEGTRAALSREFALYKLIRPIMQGGSSFLLSSQVLQYPDLPYSGWDVVEHLQPQTGDAALLAFDTPDAPETFSVRPKGLRPTALYEVESADLGVIETAFGDELMASGIVFQASGISHSHLLILRAK